MRSYYPRRVIRPALLAAVVLSLTACNAVTRLTQIGTVPPLAPVESPTEQTGYRIARARNREPHAKFVVATGRARVHP